MTLILGIDPGSRITGYGIIEMNRSDCVYVASGCIRATEPSMPGRLEEIFTGVCELIDQYCPDAMAIEKIFMARSADSALKLGQARGALIVAGVNRGLEIFEYEARKVKQAVVGTGAATKPQVQHMVGRLLRLKGEPQQDAADALAIALCHAQSSRHLDKLDVAARFRRGRLVGNPSP